MPDRRAILVVEDEPFIAMDLEAAIEDAGCTVVGPAARIAEALELLATNPVAGAILDVNLLDGDITAVVEWLVAAAVPFIIQTGAGLPPELAARYPGLRVRSKPNVAAGLVAELATLIGNEQSHEASHRREHGGTA